MNLEPYIIERLDELEPSPFLPGELNGNGSHPVELEPEPEFEDYPTPVVGSAEEPARLVEDLLALIKRYIVMTPAQSLVVALWIIHAHLVQHVEQTPYLTVTSPVRQCGKSRLLELLELLVPRPWPAVTPSEAVVYRTVHARMPTLLLDEVDAIFAPKTADRHEGLRAILNAGHRRRHRSTLHRSVEQAAGLQGLLRQGARRDRGPARHDHRPQHPDQAGAETAL